MICKQCGGTIPEGGKFCPECGTPVTLKATAGKKAASKAAHTARPLADNPFQPRTAHKKSPHPVDPIPEDVDDDDADREEVLVKTSHPIPAAPRPKPRTPAQAARPNDAHEAEEGADSHSGDSAKADPVRSPAAHKKPARPAASLPPEDEEDGEEQGGAPVRSPDAHKKPARPAASLPPEDEEDDEEQGGAPVRSPDAHKKPARPAAASTGESRDAEGSSSAFAAKRPKTPREKANAQQRAVPGRAAIAPAPPASRKVNTMVPKRLSQEELEMDEFFGGGDDPDLDEPTGFWERNLRSVITIGLLAVTFLVLIGWLVFSSTGKIFLADLRITKDAYAYKLLGDRLAQEERTKSASEAYHQALIYDPDNYEYAMLCAETFYELRDTDRAAQAAQLAISLEPDERAPYDLLKEMFPADARPANIAALLQDGATRFDDPTLAQ